jgi:hypothetical protein
MKDDSMASSGNGASTPGSHEPPPAGRVERGWPPFDWRGKQVIVTGSAPVPFREQYPLESASVST